MMTCCAGRDDDRSMDGELIILIEAVLPKEGDDLGRSSERSFGQDVTNWHF